MKGLHQILTNPDSDNDITTGLASNLSEIIGDFQQTLRDCDSLLKDKSKFKRSPANFVDNVVWHAKTESEVNSLVKRLQFHMIKVNFIVKTLEIKLLSGISRQQQKFSKELAALRARMTLPSTPTQESCFHVPEELSDRFRKALAAKNLDPSQVRDDLPLKEGFDALVYHFARCTETFQPSSRLGEEVPVEQYLDLIKSRWIIDRIKENDHFLSPDPKSLWTDCIVELDDKIRDQFVRIQQNDLSPPPLDALIRLPDESFSIWFGEEPPPRPSALIERGPADEKILELPLQGAHSTYQTTLTVFRKSNTCLGLVSATEDQNDNFRLLNSMDVDMNQTGLVPAFAASQDTSTVNSNVLLCNQGQNAKCYSFREPADVFRLQRALTGYRVSHDMSNISWHVEFDQFRKSGESGKARLQLWQLKPLPKIREPNDTESAERSSSSSVHTPQSPEDTLKLRRFWTSSTTPPAISNAPLVNGSHGAGIALTSPEPPVLILFTTQGDRYTFLHLQCMLEQRAHTITVSVLLICMLVDEKIKLEPQPCERCRQQKTPCYRYLIRSTSKSLVSKFPKLTIRRLCAQHKDERGLNSWNLGCFRYPEHPEFKNLEVLSIKYLSLHFDTFHREYTQKKEKHPRTSCLG